MIMTSRRPIIRRAPATLALLGSLALLAGAGQAAAGTRIDESRKADPNGHVEISNTSGMVEVEGWGRNEIRVEGELGKGTERLDFETSGKVTHIKVILPQKSRNVKGSDLKIRLPEGSSIAVNTVSADIAVRDVGGAQRLQSVSGDIVTGNDASEVECKTVSGDVVLTGTGETGIYTITTVSGDAEVADVAGEISINTVSGDFELVTGEATRSRMRSTSGDLTMTSQLARDARLDVESISGDIRVDFKGKVDAEFEVSSFNGDISNCFGHESTRTSQYAPGRELRFREGSGSARVRIKTLNGDVNLCTD